MLDPSFFSYVTVMSITPGPNNMMLATSGVNFGLKRTTPLLAGIILGGMMQTIVVTLLLSELLYWMAVVRLPLTLLGSAYLLWLSVKIFRAGAPQLRDQLRPMDLKASVLFQLVNPKAWVMVSNVALIYSSQSTLPLTVTAFALLNFPCIFIWAWMGDRLGAHLQTPWKRQCFNSVMAVSLVLTVIWMLYSAWQQG